MPEVKIEKIRKICTGCERGFKYGEEVVSAVVEIDEVLTRRDYCPECWKARKDEVYSYWLGIFPEKSRPNIEDMDKVQVFFDKLMEKEEVSPQIEGVRFFTALVLARKKRLKLLGSKEKEGRSWIRIEKNWDGEKMELPDPGINEEQLEEIRRNMEVLFEMELSGGPPEESA